MVTCVVTYKNGSERYFEIDTDLFDDYDVRYVDGYYKIIASKGDVDFLIAKIPQRAVRGYYFEED